MSRILITNCKSIVQIDRTNIVKGKEMAHLPGIDDAWLLIEDDKIHSYGSMKNVPDSSNTEVIDGTGRYVFPTWCDSHTHIVFAGSRETEFVSKIQGLSYEEIAKQGGGILNSAKKLATTSEDELFDSAWIRLEEMKHTGTGAIEIKSGYGLSYESELKMLRVIKRIKEKSNLTIKATFLGAHAVPTEFKERRSEYVDLLVNRLLPEIVNEGLADFNDVFCDRGFFTVEETDRILAAGNKLGLQPKIHANELDYSGGIQVGVKYGARSVDHLEFTGEEEIKCLLNSTTMPTLLPSTAFFLKLHYPPARNMIDAGLPIALASDHNPGSSPSGKMQFIISLACLYLKMLPNEAFNAATINSAYAMDVMNDLGSIAVGKQANVFITKPISSIDYIPYAFTSQLVEKVIIKGKVQ
jgi:imidazolonepropionase